MHNENKLLEYMKGRGETPRGASGVKKKTGRPKNAARVNGLLDSERRFTFIADKEQIEAMQDIAGEKGITVKEAFANALKAYINKHGK